MVKYHGLMIGKLCSAKGWRLRGDVPSYEPHKDGPILRLLESRMKIPHLEGETKYRRKRDPCPNDGQEPLVMAFGSTNSHVLIPTLREFLLLIDETHRHAESLAPR